jgi:hypothetical protein
MWQREQAVSISARNGRFWIKFHNLARVNLTHTLGTSNDLRSNFLNFIPTRGSGPPHATVGPYAHKCAGRTSVVWLHDRTPIHCAEHTPARWCMCEKPNYEWWEGMSTPRADWLLGLPLTIIYGMWLVVSNTWPQLPHTATLSTFIHTDGVTFQVMIPHMTPSIILIVIAE